MPTMAANLAALMPAPSKAASISCRLPSGVRTRPRLSCLRISPADNNDAGDVIASRLRHLHYQWQVIADAVTPTIFHRLAILPGRAPSISRRVRMSQGIERSKVHNLGLSMSLVAERGDGIDVRGFGSRVEPGEQTGKESKTHSQKNGVDGENRDVFGGRNRRGLNRSRTPRCVGLSRHTSALGNEFPDGRRTTVEELCYGSGGMLPVPRRHSRRRLGLRRGGGCAWSRC